MTQTHEHETHVYAERDPTGMTTGMLIGITLVMLIAVIGLAVLLMQPWDDDDAAIDTSPGITDDSGGGTGGTGGGAGEGASGGGGGTEGGSEGGEGGAGQ